MKTNMTELNMNEMTLVNGGQSREDKIRDAAWTGATIGAIGGGLIGCMLDGPMGLCAVGFAGGLVGAAGGVVYGVIKY